MYCPYSRRHYNRKENLAQLSTAREHTDSQNENDSLVGHEGRSQETQASFRQRAVGTAREQRSKELSVLMVSGSG